MIRKVLPWVSTIAVLAGCTMGPPVGTLRVPSTPLSFEVKEPISYDSTAGLAHMRVHLALRAATYTAIGDNDDAVFYLCPGDCVTVDGRAMTQSGVWIPKDANNSPRLFNYKGAARTRGEMYQSDNSPAMHILALTTFLDPDIIFFSAIEDREFIQKLKAYAAKPQ